jgi:hypothetical protein
MTNGTKPTGNGEPVQSMKNPAAVALGKMKSAAKSKAARENGKLGGRPRKPKRVTRRANDPN